MRRVSLGLPLLAVMSLTGPSPTFADVVLPDPLAGYCAGAEQCVHGSVDAPTSTNPPVDFGFTASGGPSTGDLLIDILIPTTLDPGGNYTLTGTLSGTASLVSTTPFAAGAFGLGSNPTLSAYLDAIPTVPDPHPSSPDNNLMNYLGSTQALVPSETGYDVYQVDLGSATRPLSSLTNKASTLPNPLRSYCSARVCWLLGLCRGAGAARDFEVLFSEGWKSPIITGRSRSGGVFGDDRGRWRDRITVSSGIIHA